MKANMHFPGANMSEAKDKRRELAALIERFSGGDGSYSTSIDCLNLFRSSVPSAPLVTVYEPSLCIIAQGSKQVMLGEHSYIYSSHQYLLVSVDLPIASRVLEASLVHPYLALQITINPSSISDILTQAQLPALDENDDTNSTSDGIGGLQISFLTPSLLDSVVRLVRLLETPHDIPVMSPLLTREIAYRLLLGDQRQRLRQMVVSNSHVYRVSRAIDWLKRNYVRNVRIDDVARIAHMSSSSFHHHFKEVTAMTPLQYQKQLRLQEARRLMLSEDIDAATASHRVGYESPSQFSREYSRLFGKSPRRDIARLRDTLIVY